MSRILIAVLLTGALSACSTTNVGLNYTAPPTVSRAAANAQPVTVGTFIDQRNEKPNWLGVIRGGFGNHVKTLESSQPAVELVQTASGVGPKLAQAMLAVLSPDAIRAAVAGEDVKTLTCVPGIGQKGAQRIILELKDRVGAPTGAPAPAPTTAAAPWKAQVQQGLVGLGWSAKEADKAIETVAADQQPADDADVAALLRAALRTLSRA